jgi:hypothetical protein
MPATGADDAALINEAQFLRELEALEETDERAVVAQPFGQAFDSPAIVDAFDALEQGLTDNRLEPSEPAPLDDYEDAAPAIVARDELVGTPLPVEPRISSVVATLVLVGCLLAGAAAAAYVQSGRGRPISVPATATR